MAEDSEYYWFYEQLGTILNLCLIAQILIKQSRHELLPTVLEYLYEQAQEIVDKHCVVRHGD